VDEVIAAVIAYGSWRGSLNRADIATLRLGGYTVRVMSDGPDADGRFDVEVS
jgi:hypothetical protein